MVAFVVQHINMTRTHSGSDEHNLDVCMELSIRVVKGNVGRQICVLVNPCYHFFVLEVCIRTEIHQDPIRVGRTYFLVSGSQWSERTKKGHILEHESVYGSCMALCDAFTTFIHSFILHLLQTLTVITVLNILFQKERYTFKCVHYANILTNICNTICNNNGTDQPG